MGLEEAGVIQSTASIPLRSDRMCPSWGGHISRACLGHRSREMLCWEGSSQNIVVAFPSSSLSPLWASLLTHTHPASQMVTLTHSCCGFLWFRPCSAHLVPGSGSRHVQLPRPKQTFRTTRRGGRVSQPLGRRPSFWMPSAGCGRWRQAIPSYSSSLASLIPSMSFSEQGKDRGLWDWPGSHLGSRVPHSQGFTW